jgi:hypothetical protein
MALKVDNMAYQASDGGASAKTTDIRAYAESLVRLFGNPFYQEGTSIARKKATDTHDAFLLRLRKIDGDDAKFLQIGYALESMKRGNILFPYAILLEHYPGIGALLGVEDHGAAKEALNDMYIQARIKGDKAQNRNHRKSSLQ